MVVGGVSGKRHRGGGTSGARRGRPKKKKKQEEQEKEESVVGGAVEKNKAVAAADIATKTDITNGYDNIVKILSNRADVVERARVTQIVWAKVGAYPHWPVGRHASYAAMW